MGAYSSKILSTIIEWCIFKPPIIDKSKYNELNTDKSKLYEIKTNNNNSIYYIHIEPSDIKSKKTIVFSHGNGSDIYVLFDFLKNLANECNVNVVCYDYIGYGLSRYTNPTEQNCYETFECLINHLLTNNKSNDIILVGQSLGSGVVIDYVSKYYWTSPIILISPFKSILNILTAKLNGISFDKFNNLNKIHKLECPVKILHGDVDKLVSINHAFDLYNLLKNKIELKIIQNANHDMLEHINRDLFIDII